MKERLTGAIILVALIVLLVPELLTGPIRTKHPHAAYASLSQDPPAAHPAPPIRTYTLTLTPAAPVRESLAMPAVQAPSAATTPQSQESGGEPSPARAPLSPAGGAPHGPDQQLTPRSALQGAKTPAHSTLRETHAEGSSGGWVVQLGSFASRQNADRLARTLSRKGFRMSVSPARAGSRVLWRVRSGPAPDRAGAGRLQARLRALGHRGELLPIR